MQHDVFFVKSCCGFAREAALQAELRVYNTAVPGAGGEFDLCTFVTRCKIVRLRLIMGRRLLDLQLSISAHQYHYYAFT